MSLLRVLRQVRTVGRSWLQTANSNLSGALVALLCGWLCPNDHYGADDTDSTVIRDQRWQFRFGWIA